MDMLRGPWGGISDTDSLEDHYDPLEDEIGPEAPPPVISQDDRRMQVRAYNLWASLLGDRHFPLIADLDVGNLPDFDPHAVLIDVSSGIEDPTVRYLGSALAEESGCDPAAIGRLSEVPGRSLASRITDHYLQIIANEAPIGFEAEFINQRGRTILYRGILLPFSASLEADRVDLIYGVINWKELADQQTTDALLLAINQVLHEGASRPAGAAMSAWADGPADPLDEPLELTVLAEDQATTEGETLADLLAAARECARTALAADDRTRQALYAAIGRAHDFAMAARAQPEDFAELVADAGLTAQARAPLLPVVKLVFGADYDKTRLTEYATVIGYAQRMGVPAGRLAGLLAETSGGLKGLLQIERAHRRREEGAPAPNTRRQAAVARKLRNLPTRPLASLDPAGPEFTLVLARRVDGEVVLVSEVAAETGLLERAARSLLA